MRQIYITKSVAIIILLIVSFGVYANTLFNGFVYDDIDQVLKNPWITDVRHIPAILFSPVWSFLETFRDVKTNYYRPMMNLIYMAEYYIFGLKPLGWHFVNITFHTLNSIMVFLIASVLFNRPIPNLLYNTYNYIYALIASILFATHPINTETVNWVACIPELSFTFFYLLSFYLYIKQYCYSTTLSQGKMGKIISVVSFFLAALSKETALTLPVLLILYDYFKGEREWRTLLKRYAPYGIVVIIYMLLRFYILGGMAPKTPTHPYLNTYQYIINIFPLFIEYLKSLLLPMNLVQFHPLNPVYSLGELRALLSLFLTLSSLLIFYRLRKIDFLYFFAFLIIIIPLVPVFYIPVLGANVFAERYLYLPSVGFVLILTYGCRQLINLNLTWRKIGILPLMGILVIIFGIYSIKTIKRNFEWKDNDTLWKTASEKYPDNYFALKELADVYLRKGLIDEAILTYQKAIKTNLHRKNPHPAILDRSRLNLVAAYYAKGMLTEAILEYKEVVKDNPNKENLIALFRKALMDAEKPSGIYDVFNIMGNIYTITGFLDEAVEYYEEALKITPDDPLALHNLEVVRKMLHGGKSK
ncbi:MAG: tetratricopeptide repeat protein [Deltaproteobacteria bacterium]|nr:tetratricopeptide repeat protein [Deltaproteobacteria bacterium]